MDEDKRREFKKIREEIAANYPDHSANSDDIVRVIVANKEEIDKMIFPNDLGEKPLFTHNSFTSNLLIGYKEPRISVVYSDPEMCAHAILQTREKIAYVNYRVGHKQIKIDADDVPQFLENVLPTGYSFMNFSIMIGDHEINEGVRLRSDMMFPKLKNPFKPFGREFHTYKSGGASGLNSIDSKVDPIKSDEAVDFVVFKWFIAESEDTRDYHNRLEAYAPWYIETASPIDRTDMKWHCLGLYERRITASSSENDAVGEPAYQFLGYTTLYQYSNPIRKERPDSLRLGQQLLVPRARGGGHGAHLMRAVFKLADEIDANELSVECPCEGFTRFRDNFDSQRAAEMKVFQKSEVLYPARLLSASRKEIIAPSSELIEEVKREMRITTVQAHRVYEILLLSRIDRSIEADLTAFRQLVKRRVLKGDADIKALPEDARKQVLEDRFREIYAPYIRAVFLLKDVDAAGGLVSVTRQEVSDAQEAWVQRQKEIEAENEPEEKE